MNSPETWIELAFTVDAHAAEELAERLIACGAAGVEQRDDGTIARITDGTAALIVWVQPNDVEPFLARARQAGFDRVATRERSEDEWRDAWKKYFAPRLVGKFVLMPSWYAKDAAPAGVVIDLDPGRAFGTGGHASTRLCLRVLSELAPADRFLDVGCGSGVLSIACAKAWPSATGIGVDVDADAVDVSRENATLNRVVDRLEFSSTPIERVPGAFPLVLANIEPHVLVPIARALADRMAPGATLVLSGILVEQAPSVEAAYDALALQLLERRDEEGWRALVYRRAP